MFNACLAKELELTLNYINYNLLIFNCLVLLLSQIYIMVVVNFTIQAWIQLCAPESSYSLAFFLWNWIHT